MGTTINSNVPTIDRRIDSVNGSRNFSTISSTATNLSSSSNDYRTIDSNNMPKFHAHDHHSTVNSTIMAESSGPIPSRLRRRQRISILKKLREKLANNNSEDFSSSSTPPSFVAAGSSASDLSPTTQNCSRRARNKNVLKIGVNGHQQPPPPSTVSSGSRSSTMRSWRLVDEFFRGAGSRGRSSGAAGTAAGVGTAGTAAGVASQQGTMSSCRSIFSNKTIIYDDKSLEIFKPAFCTIVNVDSSTEQQQSTTIGDQETDQTSNAQSVADCIRASSNAESLPYNADAGQPPQSSVQLVGWRLRQDLVNDDECPEQNRSTMNDTAQTSVDEALNGRTSLLAPEDLPQIFANGWPLPPVIPNSMINLNESYDDPKECCCTGYISHSFMIRIFIAVISLIGLSCVIVGTILGALTVSGSTRLTLCLLMIGVGVVLIIVSGIAWRLTSLDPRVSLSCWSILGLRTFGRDQSFYPDNRQSSACYRMRNGRRGAPYFSNLPSEFIWRPPPPTYQASVQEVRLQKYRDKN
uniref:Uncharacterized protein n=1 Tax=Romanomermis culicivorax TaxID=13658 RepID=A0A915JLN5_ROMCU